MQGRRRCEYARGHYVGMFAEYTLSGSARLGIFQKIAKGKLFGARCSGWLNRLFDVSAAGRGSKRMQSGCTRRRFVLVWLLKICEICGDKFGRTRSRRDTGW